MADWPKLVYGMLSFVVQHWVVSKQADMALAKSIYAYFSQRPLAT